MYERDCVDYRSIWLILVTFLSASVYAASTEPPAKRMRISSSKKDNFVKFFQEISDLLGVEIEEIPPGDVREFYLLDCGQFVHKRKEGTPKNSATNHNNANKNSKDHNEGFLCKAVREVTIPFVPLNKEEIMCPFCPQILSSKPQSYVSHINKHMEGVGFESFSKTVGLESKDI